MYQTLPLNALAMVIEDDEKLSAIYCQALKAAGFTAQPARTGKQAYEGLPIFLPALVILDLQLPDAKGEEILRSIRSDARFENTWVIVATSEPALTTNLHGVADLVLIKPVSYTQLRDLALRFRKTTSE